MVHKKFMEVNGKIYGPYYYESYREGGKVKKRYVKFPSGKLKVPSVPGKSLLGKIFKKSRVKNNFYRREKNNGYKVVVKKYNAVKKPSFSYNKTIAPYAREQLRFVKPLVRYAVLIAVIIAVLLLVGNFGVTSRVSLDVKADYVVGEVLDGNIKLILKEGELVPADSKVVVSLGGVEKEFYLRDLVDFESVSGDYYIEQGGLSGSGEGYGLIGSKKVYPEVDFQLRIFGEGGEEEEVGGGDGGENVSAGGVVAEEETGGGAEEGGIAGEGTGDSGGGAAETPAAGGEETQNGEEISVGEPEESAGSDEGKEKKEKSEKEEKGKEKDESEPASESDSGGEETSSESDSGGGEGTITGSIVRENEIIVDGKVRKGEDFEYGLEKSQTAEVVEGSVKADGGEIDEGEIKLNVKNKKAVVSTDHFAEEEGFGEEYLGKKKANIEINLEESGFIAESDSVLSVKLVYSGGVLLEAEKDISVEETGENETEIVEENETEISEMNITLPDENITLPEENVTLPEMNVTLNESVAESNATGLNVTTKQYRAVINRPVKWIKAVKIENMSAENLKIVLPKEAANISMKTGEEVGAALLEADDYSTTVDETDRNVLITGQAVLKIEKQGLLTRLADWLREISITGNVISEDDLEADIIETADSKEVVLDRIVEELQEDDLAVEYYTSGPIAVEENTILGKKVVVSGGENYTDILAYALVDERVKIENAERIKVYHWVYEESVEQPVLEEEIKETEEINESAVEITDESQKGIVNESEKVVEQPENENRSRIIANATAEEGNGSSEIISGTGEQDNESVVSEESEDESDENASLITGEVVSEIDEAEIFENNLSKDVKLVKKLIKEEVNFTAYDLDDDGFVDYVEWNVGHLSEQVYEIILITKAEHLDENRTFIEDVYDYVKAQDDNWTTIPSGDYIRVTFEQNLTREKDITIYARAGCNESVVIDGVEVPCEIYEKKKRIDEIRGELK